VGRAFRGNGKLLFGFVGIVCCLLVTNLAISVLLYTENDEQTNSLVSYINQLMNKQCTKITN